MKLVRTLITLCTIVTLAVSFGFGDIKDAAKKAGSAVEHAAKDSASAVKNEFQKDVPKVGNAIKEAANKTKEFGEEAVEKTEEVGKNVIEETKEIGEKVIDEIEELGEKVIDGVKKTEENVEDGAKKLSKGDLQIFYEKIENTLKEAPHAAKEELEAFMKGSAELYDKVVIEPFKYLERKIEDEINKIINLIAGRKPHQVEGRINQPIVIKPEEIVIFKDP
jgi:hypothetical protein